MFHYGSAQPGETNSRPARSSGSRWSKSIITYSEEILGYAVALFTCYGVFVRVSLGMGTFSLIFLGVGSGAV